MNPEQEIFLAALDERSPMARAAFLDEACADGPDIRARVEALLQAAEVAGDFLNDAESFEAETTGARIDRYRLQEKLGEGGFGVVYRAEQEQPLRRSVALKIIKLGMDTRAVVARFEAERQALAMMDHPNIARVFDGGATQAGRPFFVMELVSGVPITAFGDQRQLTVRERLELFVQVCRAIHHAHQKGIIHRDLKPSNILVALEEDRPVAKVIDFGIAKATREPLTEKTLLTRQHVFLGTPAYMSPEQVGLAAGDIDTRSDIYSLGALLYELLSGAPIFDGMALLARGYAEVQRAILSDEPPAPSQRVANLPLDLRRVAASQRQSTPARLVGELRGDLDRIVLKCLEKDRTQRYETTEDLARDIMRYLRHEPVQAQPPTLGYRTTKFVRRHHRGVFVATAALGLLTSVTVYHTHRLALERDRAQAQAQKAAKVSEMMTDLLAAGDPFRTPTPHGVLEAAASRVQKEFAAQPDVRLEVLNAIGRVYLRRGEHAKARPILTEALEAGRSVGSPDLRLAQTLSDLGVLKRETGDPAGAIALFTEAIQIRREFRGNDHNDVAISLVELGRAYNMLEQYNQSERVFREALAIRQKVLGPEHREIAVSLGDLAVLLWQKGDFEAAEPFFQQSQAMHRKTLGPDHPNVAQSMANWAQLKMDRGDFAAAEQLLREALPIFRRSFGERNWKTARIIGHLGVVYRKQRRFEEAALMLDQAVELARAEMGPERPFVAALQIERAQLHLDQGEPDRAEPLLREGLRVQRMTYVETGWRIASTKSLLGGALLELGGLEEAEALLLDAQRHLREVAGPQGRETQPTRERLAALQRSRANSLFAEGAAPTASGLSPHR